MSHLSLRYFVACSLGVGTLLGAANLGFAHGEATGIVKERMDLMDDMGDAVRVVGNMLRGKADYDAASVRQAGETISSHSGKTLLDLFPKGSMHPPSEAHPKIWVEWQAFETLANELKDAGDQLAKSVPEGKAGTEVPASVKEAFAKVGQTCSSCHKTYRLKR